MKTWLIILGSILAAIIVMAVDAMGVYWAVEAYGAAWFIWGLWSTRNDWTRS